MLRAIIFDFNGVVLDDELLHFDAMRDTVADFGIHLTQEIYWDRYLPLDDTRCLDAICRDYSVRLRDDERAGALARKARIYRRLLRDRLPLFPGAARFIINAAGRYPLALASGARREEIESTLDSAGLRSYFAVIVAAEDFAQAKPHPESFLLALERLNAAIHFAPIRPEQCLVIEDSIGGIHGARQAGMLCLAVTNSYPSERLQAADKIVASLEEAELEGLQALFEEPV
jgi:HAD superfamily hydrolase (TIGR01509 family)